MYVSFLQFERSHANIRQARPLSPYRQSPYGGRNCECQGIHGATTSDKIILIRGRFWVKRVNTHDIMTCICFYLLSQIDSNILTSKYVQFLEEIILTPLPLN